MKPATVTHRGEQFVTLRSTTDRPAEIQEALAVRDVQHVFKGDQNQAWDAVLANHCLSRAVGDSGADITFFIQDERLGTSDSRLGRIWRAAGKRYVLTEDYYRGRAGAVWEHQDASYGLFFTEAVSPEQFEQARVPLHRAGEVWERHAAVALTDAEWQQSLADLGVTLPSTDGDLRTDPATRLGPAVNREDLAQFLPEHPLAAFYYALTKTDGLYGVVPVENENMVMSSIPAGDAELKRAGAWILIQAAAKGAMRLAGTRAQRRAVKTRARQVAEWAGQWLEQHPAGSVADLQAAFGRWLTDQVFPADRVELDRASHFTRVTRDDLPSLRRPAETLHFFLDVALRHPESFTEAYNEALNRVGFGLQRMKYETATGRYTPPFFAEFAPGGAGAPVYRFGIEISGTHGSVITLTNPSAGTVTLDTDRGIRSAYDFALALFEGLPEVSEFSLIGKAATFAAELQRSPRGLGLPRQGSKYAPMVDHLVAGLRARGVLDQPTGLLIRIGLNTLDRLSAMGEAELRMPRFLADAFGSRVSCREFAGRWREVAHQAHAQLELLGSSEVGQHVHLLKLMADNALRHRGQEATFGAEQDAGLEGVHARLCAHPDGPVHLSRLGEDLSESAVRCIQRLTRKREELLAGRPAVFAARAAEKRATGATRLRPLTAAELAAEAERERVECQLLLLYAAYVRRLWQRAESLPYVNDRPYTLALYLLFGQDIFFPVCREVEFDVEYSSPCPLSACQPPSEFETGFNRELAGTLV